MADWAEIGTPKEVPNEGGPALWTMNAFGTRYRGMVVEAGPSAELLFGNGVDLIVVVEPAGGKRGLYPSRMWAPFSTDRLATLAQQYVEEKFAVQGEDAVALTVLVAAMLGREPALMPDETIAGFMRS
ncbi:MAG: hypothetical protein ACOYB2_10685 [Limnohabitans sp.]